MNRLSASFRQTCSRRNSHARDDRDSRTREDLSSAKSDFRSRAPDAQRGQADALREKTSRFARGGRRHA